MRIEEIRRLMDDKVGEDTFDIAVAADSIRNAAQRMIDHVMIEQWSKDYLAHQLLMIESFAKRLRKVMK